MIVLLVFLVLTPDISHHAIESSAEVYPRLKLDAGDKPPRYYSHVKKEKGGLFTLIITGLIRGYQKVFSNRQGEVCNFIPSCSNYAQEAIKKYGLMGILMTFDRLERCNYFAWQYKDKYYKVKWTKERDYKLYDPVK